MKEFFSTLTIVILKGKHLCPLYTCYIKDNTIYAAALKNSLRL